MSFIDVDFTKFPEYVAGDLGVRAGASVREYGAVAPIIDQSEWKAMVEAMEEDGGGVERLIVEIKDQLREGSCVSQACAAAHQIVQARQFGREKVVKLSAMSLYKQIARSAQSGAVVSDGLEAMNEKGLLPLDTPENRAAYGEAVMANTGFSKPYPNGWMDTASKFRGVEWFDVKGEAQLITALLNQHPTIVGRDGHSICYVRPMYKNGVLGVMYVNSWGGGENGWGFGAGEHPSGFGFDSMSMVRSSARWAFALRAVTDPFSA